MTIKEQINVIRTEIKADQEMRLHDPVMRVLERRSEPGLFRAGNRENGHYRDSTFLYIQSYDGDWGNRPLPVGMVFWNSPAVELFDGSTPIATNQLQVGKIYTVEVTIINDGDLEASSCIVDLFICNPSLGFNLAAAKSIGIQHVEVGPHSSTKVYFEYIATIDDPGHRCLFARVYSVTTKDYPENPDAFETATDRHVAQQNLSIVKQGDLMALDIAPFAANNVNLRIRKRNELLTRFNRMPLIVGLNAVHKELIDEFELLDVMPSQNRSNDEAPNQDTPTLGRPIKINLPGRFGGLGNIKKINQPADLMKGVTATRNKNLWQLKRQETTSRLIQTSYLKVPVLGLTGNEAVAYTVEMTDSSGKVIGGITLVVVE